jgi:hypothetical protein
VAFGAGLPARRLMPPRNPQTQSAHAVVRVLAIARGFWWPHHRYKAQFVENVGHPSNAREGQLLHLDLHPHAFLVRLRLRRRGRHPELRPVAVEHLLERNCFTSHTIRADGIDMRS